MKRMIPILAVLALLCCGTACHPEENGTEPTEQTEPSGPTGPTGPTEPAVVLVTGITLNETSVPLLVGEGATLTAAVVPDNAGNKAVSWSSSDGSIVKVDGNGKVSAVARGKADIIVSARDGSGISATCTVLVSNPCPEGAIDMGSTTAEGIKVYWAPVNLTATGFAGTQNETGDYFAWGETQPYYTSMDPLVWKEGKSEGYAWTSYQWFKGQQSDKNAIVSRQMAHAHERGVLQLEGGVPAEMDIGQRQERAPADGLQRQHPLLPRDGRMVGIQLVPNAELPE